MATSTLLVLSILIRVLTGTIQTNTFRKAGDSTTTELGVLIPGVSAKLHCAAICDQRPWCIAMSWNPMIRTCRGFTKTLTPETTPTFSHYKSLNVGEGYINMAGMMIKFTRNPMLNWQMAQEYCVNHTGRLVVLDTLEKYEAIRVHPFLQELTNWWVGTRKLVDSWAMTTGQAVDNGIQILEDSIDADCVGVWKGYMSDSPCDWGTPFICEK